jgi:hypothetical protein
MWYNLVARRFRFSCLPGRTISELAATSWSKTARPISPFLNEHIDQDTIGPPISKDSVDLRVFDLSFLQIGVTFRNDTFFDGECQSNTQGGIQST